MFIYKNMYGAVEAFSIKTFLDETYPTNDDEEAKQELIDYLSQNLSTHKNVKRQDMDHFLSTLIERLRAISYLCEKKASMDDLDSTIISAVECIAKSIDDDLKYVIRDKQDILHMSNGSYFLDLSTFADAMKFYQNLLQKNKIRYTISRKNFELLYNQCDLDSNFSNVLFMLSWLNVLRVYSTNLIYFNYNSPIYL